MSRSYCWKTTGFRYGDNISTNSRTHPTTSCSIGTSGHKCHSGALEASHSHKVSPNGVQKPFWRHCRLAAWQGPFLRYIAPNVIVPDFSPSPCHMLWWNANHLSQYATAARSPPTSPFTMTKKRIRFQFDAYRAVCLLTLKAQCCTHYTT